MPYSTGDSLVVPYQSTDPAQQCLTSQFGWDAVLSLWYDRMTRAVHRICTPVQKSNGSNKKREETQQGALLFLFLFFHSRGLGIVGLLLESHIKHQYQMLGCDYLNSIRKSWLLDRRLVARFENLQSGTCLRVQKQAIIYGIWGFFAKTAYFVQGLQFRYGVVGNISACHADARGSIPRFGVFFFCFVTQRAKK